METYNIKLLKNAVTNYGRYYSADHAMGNDNYNMAHYGTDEKHFRLVSSVKCSIFGLLSDKKPKLTDVIIYCRTKGVTIL
jgi:hypothetical protein